VKDELYVGGGQTRGRRRIPRGRIVWALIGLLLAALLLAFLRVGSPEATLELDRPGLGPSTTLTGRLSETGRGLSDVRLEVEQDGNVTVVAEQQHEPRAFWRFWGDRVQETVIEGVAGRSSIPELEPGQATVRLVAERAGSFLRHPKPLLVEQVVPVKIRPPSLVPVSGSVVVRQGGSSVVVYRIDEPVARDGVRSGERWFPGSDLPGGSSGERFAFFAAAHDLTDGNQIKVEAEDELGNLNSQLFLADYRLQSPRQSTIQLSESFLARVVPPIIAETGRREKETLLDTYLDINRNLRKENDDFLIELSRKSRQEFFWQPPFKQQPNSQVTDAFASERDYMFDGKKVDHQTHLGYDLASRSRDPILAANSGVVLFAGYLGIYGNTVVVDHGFGLTSLYAHLSAIDVRVGDTVETLGVLGRSGQTGLAGGDHLHFSMYVHGVPVDAVEWWDSKWIETRIEVNLGAALPFL
jgi:murein DD-endopeptidase MepM/ murein hydrolase activator NlpD